jgi:hypothetical protein
LIPTRLLWAALLSVVVHARFNDTANDKGSLNINQHTGSGVCHDFICGTGANPNKKP